MTEYLCNHCGKPLAVSVIYDHGRRFHPLCYEAAVEKEAREQEKIKKDWSQGLYES